MIRAHCALALALATLLSVAQAADRQAGRPNILVILADDLGYGEIVGHGTQEIPTPRVLSIAKNGVCFTNGYVSCPYCSPTRAGLLTGRYQERFGHEFNPGAPADEPENFGLPLTEVTLADRLKERGYATGIVGKWHLGSRGERVPQKRGFDEFFGFLSGAHAYAEGATDPLTRVMNHPLNQIMRGTTPIDETSYLTDAFGREAVAFIDHHKNGPFFLYLAFNAVHAPLQASEKYLSRFPHIKDERRRTYAAMQSAMDDNIGLVLDKLQQEKLTENTLIFFLSDNGGPTESTTSGNSPLHGFKAQIWEGGIRIPFMVEWKGKLPEGKVYDYPVISLDILPTVVTAAGGSLNGGNPLDGVDLVPYLNGQMTGPPHNTLYWRFGTQWAIRQGDFKLVQPPQGPVQLIDLAHDVGEEHNLVSARPELFNELQTRYQAWNAQLMEPLWEPPGWQRQQMASPTGDAGASGQVRPATVEGR